MTFNIKQLTDNFTFDEVLRSVIASERGINNFPNHYEPHANIYMNAYALAMNVNQPIREYCGKVIVTSWYSCPELSDIIGRSPSSQHRIGQAADFTTPDMLIAKVMEWIIWESDIPFDQAIYEYRNDTWIIHVSHVRDGHNRREAMISPKRGEFTSYPARVLRGV